MSDRRIKILENGKLVTRGASNQQGSVAVWVTKDETLSYTFDWSDWLGSNTISSSVNEANGPTAGSITSTDTTTSFTISSNPGFIRHRITDSSGQTKEVRIRVRSPDNQPYQDYGWCM